MWGRELKLWFCDLDQFGLAILANFSNFVILGYLVLAVLANFANWLT